MTTPSRKSTGSALNAAPPLNLSGISRSLWLVKIPRFVAEDWSTRKDGEALGRFSSASIKNPATGNIVKKLHVTLNSSVSDIDGPLQFTLDEIGATGPSSNASGGNTSSLSQDIMAFIHSSQTNQYSIVGKCTKSLVLKPKDSQQYHTLRRKRLEVESQRPEAQALKADPTFRPLPATSYVLNVDPGGRSSSAGPALKKIKIEIDRSAVRSRIFSLFENDDKVLFPNILARCKDISGITEDNLKDTLQEYAVYNRKGQYHSYWELKPEYVTKKTK